MSRDLFLKVGCLLCAALLIITVAGCGKKGDPRPPAPVTTIEDSTGIQYSSYTEDSTGIQYSSYTEDSTYSHSREGGNPEVSAGTVFSPPDT